MRGIYTLGGTERFRILNFLPRQMCLIENIETGFTTRVMISALKPVDSRKDQLYG
jgi:hypothetical protein